MFGGAVGGLNEKDAEQMGDVVVTLECTLTEFYCGCMKTFEFTREHL